MVAAIVHRNLRTEDRSLPIAVARHHLRRHHLRRVEMARHRTEAAARAVAHPHIVAARRVAHSPRVQAVAHAPIRVAEAARVAATRVEDNSP